jgi:sulfur-carrier protein
LAVSSFLPFHSVAMIRVVLPQHLRTLANTQAEVKLPLPGPVTVCSILDVLELRYPMLRGAIRDHETKQRRALVRFFACEDDFSHGSPDAPLPDAIATGAEPFFIVGSIAGG